MADSSEPAFLFLYRKGAVAPVDYLSTFATAPFAFAGGRKRAGTASLRYFDKFMISLQDYKFYKYFCHAIMKKMYLLSTVCGCRQGIIV